MTILSRRSQKSSSAMQEATIATVGGGGCWRIPPPYPDTVFIAHRRPNMTELKIGDRIEVVRGNDEGLRGTVTATNHNDIMELWYITYAVERSRFGVVKHERVMNVRKID